MWAATKSRYSRAALEDDSREVAPAKNGRVVTPNPVRVGTRRMGHVPVSLPWCRSRPLRRGTVPLDDGVEDVSHPVADEVGSQHDQTDRHAGKQHRPVGDLQELPRFTQIHPPARGGRLEAETEE